MEYLFIFNDSPHGNQRSYNGLRMAASLSKAAEAQLRIFLLGDGVLCGLAGLNPAHADYNPQEMLLQLAGRGIPISACGTCMEARGIPAETLIKGVKRSTLDELTEWTTAAEKVISF